MFVRIPSGERASRVMCCEVSPRGIFLSQIPGFSFEGWGFCMEKGVFEMEKVP